MRRPSPDRLLRKLVADIGRAHPDDIAAILARLDPEHQSRARALFATFVGREFATSDGAAPGPGPAPDATKPEAWPAGLSAWLLVRLRQPQTDSASSRPRDSTRRDGMTPMALAALRESARALPALRTAPAAPPRKRVPRWRALERPKAWRR